MSRANGDERVGPVADERRAAMRDVAYLAGCALRDAVPAGDRVRGMDLRLVLRLARRHQMEAMCGMALERAGVHDEGFERDVAQALRKAVIMDHEWRQVKGRLDAAGIWYAPLKGTVLKDLYPSLGMRQMADMDVLFDASRGEDVRAIMEELGFTTQLYNRNNQDVYHKLPVSNFEMHRTLFNPYTRPVALYDCFSSLAPGHGLIPVDEGSCEYCMSAEDMYVYVCAHAFMHFEASGTGLRSFMDMYVFWHSGAHDDAYIKNRLRELGIEQFEERARSFALHLFDDDALAPWDGELMEYVTFSGTYGTRALYAQRSIERLGGGLKGRVRYLLERVFPPLTEVNVVHPFFYDHKVLLPFLPVYRLAKGISRSKGAVAAELRALRRR